FIDRLVPALVKAKEAGEDAKVLSVLAAGKGGEIDLDDLGLKKKFSVTNAALSAPTYNDLMLQVTSLTHITRSPISQPYPNRNTPRNIQTLPSSTHIPDSSDHP
ncbi:hypothetical protein C0993_004329, partial [Termitomyces sp. T159_Od127]